MWAPAACICFDSPNPLLTAHSFTQPLSLQDLPAAADRSASFSFKACFKLELMQHVNPRAYQVSCNIMMCAEHVHLRFDRFLEVEWEAYVNMQAQDTGSSAMGIPRVYSAGWYVQRQPGLRKPACRKAAGYCRQSVHILAPGHVCGSWVAVQQQLTCHTAYAWQSESSPSMCHTYGILSMQAACNPTTR